MKPRIYFNVSKEEKQKQSILYATAHMCNILNTTNNKIFGVTSTLDNIETKKFIIQEISKSMSKMHNLKVLNCICNVGSEKDLGIEYMQDNSIDMVVNVNFTNINDILKENEYKYDVIFVILDPVNLFANALSCAKFCDSVIMVERYLYSKYNDYEKSLLYLKDNNIEVSGVITYR